MKSVFADSSLRRNFIVMMLAILQDELMLSYLLAYIKSDELVNFYSVPI